MIDRSTMPDDRHCTQYQADGKLLANFILQPEVILMLQEKEGHRYMPGWLDGATHYVKEGAVAARPANSARLDGMTLRDLPVPCGIVIDGVRYDCDEPTAELELTVPKTYQIQVDAFPMTDATFEVTIP